jgi:Protein of unknown function (DUF2730).
MLERIRKTLLAGALAMMIIAASAHAAEPGQATDSSGFGLFSFTWRDAREFLLVVIATASTVGPSLWWALRSKLAGEFAAKEEFHLIANRMGDVERQLHRLPSDADFKDLNTRVARLEGEISVANANLEGLKLLLDRIDYSVKLLVRHHINGGGDE